MSENRIWICPALCGCEIELVADWSEPITYDALGRSVSYRHPIGYTITNLTIINVCAAHDSYKTDPLPKDPYGGAPGYMSIPVNPTEAEALYIRLYQYSGGTWKPDTCGCTIYQCSNRFLDDSKHLEHSIHTKRCKFHSNDIDHSVVIKENSDKELIKQQIKDDYGLTDDDIKWSFEDDRSLTLNISKLSINEKVSSKNSFSSKSTRKINLP